MFITTPSKLTGFMVFMFRVARANTRTKLMSTIQNLANKALEYFSSNTSNIMSKSNVNMISSSNIESRIQKITVNARRTSDKLDFILSSA
jgi:hypothetical protein